MISIRCSLSSEVLVSAIRTAVILVALLLWAESRLIVLSTRAMAGIIACGTSSISIQTARAMLIKVFVRAAATPVSTSR